MLVVLLVLLEERIIFLQCFMTFCLHLLQFVCSIVLYFSAFGSVAAVDPLQ
jgi:hypothetical protein